MSEELSRRGFLAAVAGASWGLPAILRITVEAATYFEQGQEQFRRGELDAAIATLTKAIDIDPRHEEALDLRSVVYEALGRHEQAIADHTAILRLNPSPHNFLMRGICAMFHDPALAIADFSEVIRRQPMDANAYCFRAITNEEMRWLDLALADFTTAQALDEEDPEGWTEDVARVRRLLRQHSPT